MNTKTHMCRRLTGVYDEPISLATVNPTYAAMRRKQVLNGPVADYQPRLATLPHAPKNAGPVLGLYHNSRADNYGNRGYPSNTCGYLIKDLVPSSQPMSSTR